MATVSLTKLLFERLGTGAGECEFELATTRDARSVLRSVPRKLTVEPLFKDRVGGVFLRWNLRDAAPIVYLGSNGKAYVAAESDRAVATLLAYGSGLVECMGYWWHHLTEAAKKESQWSMEPAAFVAEHGLTAAAIDAAVAAPTGQHSHYLPTLMSAMRGLAITLEPTPLQRVGQANRTYLTTWLEHTSS
jgi:hypothetical protein